MCCIFFINVFAYKRYDNNYINCIIVLGEVVYTYIVALMYSVKNVTTAVQSDILLIVAVCLAGMNVVVFYLMKDILRKEYLNKRAKNI